jgi:hypothetical protein
MLQAILRGCCGHFIVSHIVGYILSLMSPPLILHVQHSDVYAMSAQYFVHVVREGQATVVSLAQLKQYSWPSLT